ncbi:MAG: protein kinase, partial [Acidobacteriota bacterium]
MRQQNLLSHFKALPAKSQRRVLTRLEEPSRTVAAADGSTLAASSGDIDRLLATGAGGLRGALWERLATELANEPGGEEALLHEELGGQVRVESILGHGGMGAVYRGFDTWLERPVAVKTIREDLWGEEASHARFRREARLLSKLDHPNICRVYALLRHAGRDFLVLELIEGAPLSATGRLDDAEKLTLARDIAEALVAAHDQNIVHRDLKPGNVMVTSEGRAKVLDFGLSRVIDPSLGSGDESAGVAEGRKAEGEAAEQEIAGTLAYMSPEQARGEELTPASDLYSFGLLLQELFTGRPAHPRDLGVYPLLRRARSGERAEAGELPPALGSLVDRLTRLDAADRPSAREASDALRRLIEEPERRRRRLWAAALAALSLGVLASTALWTHRAARAPMELPEARRLMLAPVLNATDDPALDWIEQGLMGLVGRSLEDLIEIVPPEEWQPEGGAWPARLEDLGADVGIAASLESDGRGYLLSWTVHRPGEAPVRRSLRGLEPSLLARELSRRLAGVLRPGSGSTRRSGSPAQDFPREPFLDRLYASGLERLKVEGPEDARPFFEVLLREDPDFVPAAVALATVQRHGGDVEGAVAALEELLSSPGLADRDRFRCLEQLLLISVERGDGRDAVEGLLGQLLDAASGLEPIFRARHLEAAANAWMRLGEAELARTALDDGKRLFAELGRPRDQLTLLHIEAVL